MLGQPQFVSVDDYKNYWGEDLRAMLRSNNNVSNQAETFLARVEDRLMNWIDNNSFRRIKYSNLNEYQLEQFKKAILTQAKYMYKNGDLGLDSGYDPERGKIIEQIELNAISVCQAAINFLANAGLFNLVMKNRPRVNRSNTGNVDFDDLYGGNS